MIADARPDDVDVPLAAAVEGVVHLVRVVPEEDENKVDLCREYGCECRYIGEPDADSRRKTNWGRGYGEGEQGDENGEGE
jgi:hypothetical protein